MLPVPMMLTCVMKFSSGDWLLLQLTVAARLVVASSKEATPVGMDTRWLDDEELDAWVRLIAVVELLPGVLDSQLRRDAGLTHFEYFVLAMLSEAPERTLRMTALAQRTNATLPRLSHVVRRLEERGLVRPLPLPGGRARDERAAHRRGLGSGGRCRSRPRRERSPPRHRRAHPGTGRSARCHRVEPSRAARPGGAHDHALTEHQRDRSASRLGEPVLVGVDDRVDAVAHVQLRQDPAHVGLDRRLGDDEGLGDLGVRQAASDELEGLPLPLGERGQAVGCRRRCPAGVG